MSGSERRMGTDLPDNRASASEVDAFLRQAARLADSRRGSRRGRLLFAMDATASRQPTWDRAAHIQAEMFRAADALGGLEMQLVFYRGFGEFRASRWLADPDRLARMMAGVACLAGQTQLAKVLKHAINEARDGPVDALVMVGDCLEEDVDRLGELAGQLGLLGVPAFLFHEGGDPVARFGFDQVARLTKGACVSFAANSPHLLNELLGAVAVYAAGGRPALKALAERRGGAVRRLTSALDRGA